MLIEKVYGINATNISLNERFTILQTAFVCTDTGLWKDKPGSSNQNSFRNRFLIEEAARQYDLLAERRAIRERSRSPWRNGQLRRFGSESCLPNLRRSNSYDSIYEIGLEDRLFWMGSNRNSRFSSSFGNLAPATWGGHRRPRRRGNRARFRGGMQGRVAPVSQRLRGGEAGGGRGRGRGRGRGLSQRGRGRGRGRGAFENKPIPSKEELDDQLDEYMACTKSALDKDLDVYMKNAMDIEYVVETN